jgi:hypothetical protein
MKEPCLKTKQKKRITDEFIIEVGEDCHSHSGFICSSTRKGTTMPEPYDAHRINEWIIGYLGLKHFKNYRIKVTVTLLGEIKK